MLPSNALTRTFSRLREFSAFLLIGTVLALIWANVDQATYHAVIEAPLSVLFEGGITAGLQWITDQANIVANGGEAEHGMSFHFIVNDIFMVLFFGMAAKEVSESLLPGGALSSVKKAALPAIATAGGVLGPVGAFFLFHAMLGIEADVASAAWAVPTATDIAYCWLFAGLIFGRSHPAVTFLLVLAVLDDLIGMLILAVYYTPEVHVQWLGLVVLAILICEGMRRKGVKSFWPYLLIGGPLCWFGLHNTGVHAALALVPVVPFMPHAERDAGLFKASENPHNDTMEQFEHFISPIVDVGLLTFGLANAGVLLNGEALTGSITWLIFLSLIVGKTVGIFVFTLAGQKMGLRLPHPITMPQVAVIGCVAGIGFTVALFVTTVALSQAPAQGWHIDETTAGMLKLGALLSFAAGPLAWLLSLATHVEKINTPEEAAAAAAAGEAAAAAAGH
ncbi:Na+/H+ antiporter NhaA [Bradymonas sediminis]|uniref:Na(+)/H(+) antiporter NhaA n=1 Tax=Bradymonas sediminis TaxID=1548548 RepID=A0A2Z4FLA4_9DELT|nr:Na+/H+ antiporter NhaA [Bradymonas sediminis]AWV89692.1 sodium:proton antiporter [Bradymonas sediminis]TDP76567.1 sodium/proton antiporter (NhaA family) [Bradymonas sediminis]